MQSYLLCTLAMVAFPSVLALRCYVCVPKPPNWCTLPEHMNVTDCDTIHDPDAPSPAPGMKYDVCVRASYELALGPDVEGQTFSANAMTCATESWCDQMKEVACNATNLESVGATMSKCEFSCCSEDMCNDVSSKAASFIITFPSMAVIFAAGFFVH